MNTQPTPTDEQIHEKDLVTLSVAELEERLKHLSPALEKSFHAIGSYAEGAVHIESQLLRVIGLEQHIKKLWAELEAIVDAIISYAIFSEQNELKWNKLAHGVQEEMAFLQAVTSGEDITPEWLARRDALVAQTTLLVEDVDLKEAIRQCVYNNQEASLRLWRDIALK